MDILLFNPNAGAAKRLGLTTEQLVERLAAKGLNPQVPHLDTDEEMLNVAIKAPGRVIVAGGDGTVHSLLKALSESDSVELAIIPAGTANHLATALGIPVDLDAAIDTIVESHTRRIDLGKANGTIFSQAAGAGLHAKVFEMYGEHKEKSAIDAAKAGLATLVDWTPQPLEVNIDGEPYEGVVTQITAANTPMYGGSFLIAPDAKLDDGLLDVVIVGDLSKLEIVEYGVAATTGSHIGLPKTYVTRAKKVSIKAIGEEPVEVHADAEPIGQTPVEIEVLPGRLTVVVPKETL